MTLEVLLLAADRNARDYVLGHLGRLRVTVAASPSEAEGLLATHRYALVLITNFGIPPQLSVAVIPAKRDYPVLFLTGHVNERIESACAEKAIPWLRVPEELDELRRELRIALEGPDGVTAAPRRGRGPRGDRGRRLGPGASCSRPPAPGGRETGESPHP